MRAGDPLQLPESEPEAPRKPWSGAELRGVADLLRGVSAIHVSRDPEEYFEIWNEGFDEGWSQAWAARLITSPAAVLAVLIFAVGFLLGFAVR